MSLAKSTSCRAALFHSAGEPIALREFPLPEPRAGEALVRVTCCTLCGSDLHTISGKRDEPTPSILGHEILGIVAEVGETPLCDIKGNPLQPGDRVTWSTSVSCGQCDRCLSGLPQKCRNLTKYGHERAEGRFALSGGLSEFLLLRPGSSVVKLAAEIPDEVMCPVNCATATVAAAYRTAGEIAGKRVLIFGAGLLGLTAAAFAKSRGAERIVVCDQNPARLEFASRFGADRTLVWGTEPDGFDRRAIEASGGAGFDLILELSGSPDAVEAGCRLADIRASIVLVGSVMKSRTVQIDPENVVRRWLSIRGVHNYIPDDLRTAVAFLRETHERFPFASLVGRTFPLVEINDAVEYAVRHRPVRIAIRP